MFGSEIKALLQHPDVPHEIDQNGVADLLLLGPGRTPGYGVFRTIREVKPAHCGYYMQGSLHLHPYWELHAAVHTDSFAETAAHVRELLTDTSGRMPAFSIDSPRTRRAKYSPSRPPVSKVR